MNIRDGILANGGGIKSVHNDDVEFAMEMIEGNELYNQSSYSTITDEQIKFMIDNKMLT